MIQTSCTRRYIMQEKLCQGVLLLCLKLLSAAPVGILVIVTSAQT